jgi:hypothetical protein
MPPKSTKKNKENNETLTMKAIKTDLDTIEIIDDGPLFTFWDTKTKTKTKTETNTKTNTKTKTKKNSFFKDKKPKPKPPIVPSIVGKRNLDEEIAKINEENQSQVQEEFKFRTGEFKSTYAKFDKDYKLESTDYAKIATSMETIVASFRGMISPIIVRHNLTHGGTYLNLYNNDPITHEELQDNIAHISFHTNENDNVLYHFKIMKPELIIPPLTIPLHDKHYTITFKIYKNAKTGVITAQIISGVHNSNTEEECPPAIIETFQFVLDNIVRCLNPPTAGKTRRHKRINKKQPEKSRRKGRRRSRRMR